MVYGLIHLPAKLWQPFSKVPFFGLNQNFCCHYFGNKNVRKNGTLENGKKNGTLENGNKNGSLENGNKNGTLGNGNKNGSLQNGKTNGT